MKHDGYNNNNNYKIIKIIIIKRQTSIDKNVEKLEPSNIVVLLLGKPVCQFLKMLITELSYNPTTPLLSI